MTDSAGTPAGPERPAGELPTGAPGQDDDGTADGRTSDSDEPADEAAEPGAEPAEPGEGQESARPVVPGSGSSGGEADRPAPDTEDNDAADGEDAPTPAAERTAPAVSGPGSAGGTGEGHAEGTGDSGDRSAARPPRRRRHWLRWTALGVSVVVLAAAGTAWWAYRKLDQNITTDTTVTEELKTYEKERPTPVVHDALNVLLIGSDTRAGKGNSRYGSDASGSQRSDTTILLHLAADRESATAVSIPRDLMAEIPSCRKPEGGRTDARFAQFNWAFQFGGTACTIRTVEKLTGIRVDHHMVIDFSGFKSMVDAVDGVEVCLKESVDDQEAHLRLAAGRQKLNGEQALGFVRARHGLGDGSDTQRMGRQQRFLGALFKKVQSNGVLLNPTRLYPVLNAATKSITTDEGLDSLKDLYDLASSMSGVPTENVRFLTVPRQAWSVDPNRDELVQPDATNLFRQLRDDQPVSVTQPGVDGENDAAADDKGGPGDSPSPGLSDSPTPGLSDSPTPGNGESTSPGIGESATPGASKDASPTPTFTGSNASERICE